jgi:hypothetical protein
MIKKLAGVAVLWLALAVICAVLKVTYDNQHYQICSSAHIEGKFQEGMCMSYAIALSKRLSGAGLHGRLVLYSWCRIDATSSNSHVFVRYVSSNGDVWIVDNEIGHPIKVSADASDMELIFILGGITASEAAQHLRIGLVDGHAFSCF